MIENRRVIGVELPAGKAKEFRAVRNPDQLVVGVRVFPEGFEVYSSDKLVTFNNRSLETTIFVAEQDSSSVTAGIQTDTTKPVGMESLSPSERVVLDILTNHAGFTNREISEAIGVTEAKVKNHLTKVYDKLGVNNRTQAVVYAISRQDNSNEKTDRTDSHTK